MATVDERYAAATAQVRRAIAALTDHEISYVVHADRSVEWYSGPTKAADLRLQLLAIDGRWLRAKGDREGIVRGAEGLAARAVELVPIQGCERDAGVIDFQTPGSIKAEMDTVAGLVHQLEADVRASDVDAGFKDAWHGFVIEWERFYADHDGWFSRWSYSSYEKTVEFRKRTLAWREKFVALGGKANGPTDKPPQTASDQLQQYSKWLLIGGALLLGWKVLDHLRDRGRPRDGRTDRSTRRQLNAGLARVANRRDAGRARRAQPLQPQWTPQIRPPACGSKPATRA
jgi:hypothetical protein